VDVVDPPQRQNRGVLHRSLGNWSVAVRTKLWFECGKGFVMWRRWISGLAVFGMLLHVAVVVRHHQMTGAPKSAVAAIAEQAAAEGHPILVVEGMVICQTDQGNSGGGPAKSKPQCPLCTLATASITLVSSEWALPFAPPIARTGQTSQSDQRIEVIRRLRPPSRAPPAQIV